MKRLHITLADVLAAAAGASIAAAVVLSVLEASLRRRGRA